MQKYAPASNGNKNPKFYCEKCDYGCNRRFLMTQHEKTQKHQMLKNAQKCSSQVQDNSALHKCKCGKKYKHIQSFKRHVKNCKIAMDSQELVIEKSDKTTDELRNMLSTISEQYKNMVIENAEMRKIVTEMIPRIGNNNTTINNQINIQMFLNEECKDALNLTDFIDTLKLDMADLDSTRENGYVVGIANIFLRGLKALDLNKRPIHCSDLKREVLYVKDDGIWEQENEEKQKIKHAITSVAKKQINAIKQWEEQHPGWQNTEKGTKEYCEMVQQVTTPTNDEKDNRIIKSIASGVVLDKEL
tara:strand:- start:1542 stop:2447 length:906 start_codon:yes stop_codon:yes gene_type:complete